MLWAQKLAASFANCRKWLTLITYRRPAILSAADRVWEDNIARDLAKTAYSDAEVLALADRYPRSPGPLHRWVDLAIENRDWEEVIRRATVLRQRFPDYGYGFQAMGRSLCELKRFDEADAILASAVRRLPSHSGLAAQYAWAAFARQDWAEACKRWVMVQKRFPDRPGPYVNHARTLIKMESWDAAEVALAAVHERFPKEADGHVLYAQVAHRRGEWQEAARRWAVVRDNFDSRVEGYVSGSVALRNCGRIDDALAVIASAATIFPNHPQVQAEQRRLMLQREQAPQTQTPAQVSPGGRE